MAVAECRETGPPASESPSKQADVVVNPSRSTRVTCLVLLGLTYVISITLLGAGIGMLVKQELVQKSADSISLPKAVAEMIPLFINVLSTVLMEGLGLIHKTTLRWCLQREGRLTFSSNLRLFTASRTCLPNGRVANLLNAIFTVLTYASSSLLFVKVLSTEQVQAGYHLVPSKAFEHLVAVSWFAIMVMSCSLLGQAILATWAYNAVSVPTWSSSPLGTAFVCVTDVNGNLRRQPHRSLRGVGDSASQEPVSPRERQKSAWTAHYQIRVLLRWFWILFGVISAWWLAVLIAVYVAVKKCDPAKYEIFCPVSAGSRSGWFPIPDVWGVSPFVLFRIPFDATFDDPVSPFAFFVVIAGFQAFLTLGLHCLDLLVGLAMDEDIWRTTASAGGYSPQFNSIKNMATSWKWLTVFACKPVVHWLYGLGMSYTYNQGIIEAGIVMRPAQLLYLSVVVLMIASGATFVATRGREGPQPVTFGHIQTTIDLVDDWQSELHWGHKGEDSTTGFCMAGTSSKRLPDILMKRQYL